MRSRIAVMRGDGRCPLNWWCFVSSSPGWANPGCCRTQRAHPNCTSRIGVPRLCPRLVFPLDFRPSPFAERGNRRCFFADNHVLSELPREVGLAEHWTPGTPIGERRFFVDQSWLLLLVHVERLGIRTHDNRRTRVGNAHPVTPPLQT